MTTRFHTKDCLCNKCDLTGNFPRLNYTLLIQVLFLWEVTISPFRPRFIGLSRAPVAEKSVTSHGLIIFNYVISVSYGNEKGPPLSEAVPLCGVVNKFLTNFNDFYDVYLFGVQTIRNL